MKYERHLGARGRSGEGRRWDPGWGDDITAAETALAKKRYLQVIDDCYDLDEFMHKAYDILASDPDSRHSNWVVFRNCKTEALKLIKKAKELKAGANK